MKFPLFANFILGHEHGFLEQEFQVTVLAECYDKGFYAIRIPAAVVKTATDRGQWPGSWYDADGSLVLSYVSCEAVII